MHRLSSCVTDHTITGYESKFDMKSFADELELEELDSFFHECDLFPSNMEIEDGIDVIFQGKATVMIFSFQNEVICKRTRVR